MKLKIAEMLHSRGISLPKLVRVLQDDGKAEAGSGEMIRPKVVASADTKTPQDSLNKHINADPMAHNDDYAGNGVYSRRETGNWGFGEYLTRMAGKRPSKSDFAAYSGRRSSELA